MFDKAIKEQPSCNSPFCWWVFFWPNTLFAVVVHVSNHWSLVQALVHYTPLLNYDPSWAFSCARFDQWFVTMKSLVHSVCFLCKK